MMRPGMASNMRAACSPISNCSRLPGFKVRKGRDSSQYGSAPTVRLEPSPPFPAPAPAPPPAPAAGTSTRTSVACAGCGELIFGVFPFAVHASAAATAARRANLPNYMRLAHNQGPEGCGKAADTVVVVVVASWTWRTEPKRGTQRRQSAKKSEHELLVLSCTSSHIWLVPRFAPL